jgi:hypothetical protein
MLNLFKMFFTSGCNGDCNQGRNCTCQIMYPEKEVIRMIEDAIGSERNRCAKIASDWDLEHKDTNYGICIAKRIMKNGKKRRPF